MSELIDHFERLRRYLTTDPLDIENTFATTPMIMQEAGELAARAIRIRDTAKDNIGVAEANATDRLRKILVNGKEPAQNRIDSMLPKDEEVQQAKEAHRAAAYDAHICQTLCESLKSQSMTSYKVADLVVSGYFQPSALAARRREGLHAAREAAKQGSSTITGGRVVRPTA